MPKIKKPLFLWRVYTGGDLILVPIFEVETVNRISFLSNMMITFGGLFCGLSGVLPTLKISANEQLLISFFLIGIVIMIIGYIIYYFEVHKKSREWRTRSVPLEEYLKLK